MSHEAMKNTSRTSSTASTSTASTSSDVPPTPSHGLRSQLGHLLPKHALFHVHVQIEQLSNVPLISGEFAVRWRFKNVQSRSGILSKMRGNRSWSSRDKGKGRASDPGFVVHVTPAEGDRGPDYDETGGDSSHDEEATDDEYESLENGRERSSSGDFYPGHGDAASAPGAIQQSASTTSTSSTGAQSFARGITPWRPLQSYNVRWDHSVNVLVQMDVHRETGELLSNRLKLVLVQRVIQGDLNAPQHPRLGAVYLNLAEYADAGPVTRRYLLRESKTNATLKLTIELEHVGGAQHYRAPPLRKGEILASVTGLLTNNELLRTSVARELDEYTREARGEHTHTQDHAFMRSDGTVDEEALASAAGLHSTEDLIESLFNPLPTAQSTPTPFTYYAPLTPTVTPTTAATVRPQEQEQGQQDYGSSDSLSLTQASVLTGSTGSDQRVSVDQFPVDSSPEMATLPLGQGSGHRTWWRKIRSRPSTPAHRRFNLPPHEAEAARA